jgi:hypothetical protein
VSFDGGAFVDLSHSPDFTSASNLRAQARHLSNFTLIASNASRVGTSLSGVISRTDGVEITRGEGQTAE